MKKIINYNNYIKNKIFINKYYKYIFKNWFIFK